MPYSTLADVKRRLGDRTFTAAEDSAITDFIEQADAFIDGLLSAAKIGTPLSPVPAIIKHASADLAAQLFRSREAPPEEKKAYFEQAKEQVQIYMTSKGDVLLKTAGSET